MSKLFLKSIAVITSTLFIATNLSWANISNEPLRSESNLHAPITSIQIPEALGTIQDQHISAAGSPFVVLIQDAHAVTEAQIQIQKLIQYLGEKYGISLAALEGTAGKMDATLLRAFPDGKAKERVLSDYLSRGEITAAEMAAIFNARRTEFFGIEDMKLYEENYFAYLTAVKNQKSIFTSLKKSKSELDSRRKTVYSEKHNEFHLQVESFRTGKTAVLELFKYFRLFDLKKYPKLKKICDLSDQEITKKNIRQVSDIKGTELFGEMESFISETENSFSVNQEQKEIVQAYRRNALLHNLASLELTKEQWSAAKNAPREFASAVDFYKLALRRDEVLHQNLNQLLKKQKVMSAIVIAGGFHAQGFKEALKKSGYSYAVVLPALRSAKGHENYLGLMQGSLSYKQYFKNSLYDAFLKDASIKLAHALDSQDAAQKLKYWRDEVIREAARQGRTGDSGKYTRYIDSLNAKSREEILASVKKVLDSFLAENIQKLGNTLPASSKASALIQPQAHPLMTESGRFLDFAPADQSSGNSLGVPAEIQKIIAEIQDVNPVTFEQKTTKLPWDKGQKQALRYGINPQLMASGLVLDKIGSRLNGRDDEWWRRNHQQGNLRTQQGAQEMVRSKRSGLANHYRRYFVGVGPEGGDFSWYVIHQILHDIFLSSLDPKLREEFLDLVIAQREFLIKRNEERKLRAEYADYFEPDIHKYDRSFGLNREFSKDSLTNADGLVNLSEVFTRLGQEYLGYLYKRDNPRSVELSAFHPFFDKIKLRASEEDLNALLTSLKATARSLGEETGQTAATKDDSSEFRALTEWEVSDIVQYFIERDKFIEGLTVESLKDEKLLPSIKAAFDDQEAKIFERIREVTTDKETAFPVIVEQAEDMLFGKYHRAYVGMVSVPLVKATEINKTFKLKGFADYFKGVVNKKLSEKSHRGEKLALMEDPEKPQSGYLGGRIVLLNVTPETLGDMLPNVIQEALAEVKEKYKSKILDPTDYESFCREVESMSFFASHAEVYLPKEDIKGASGDFELNYVLNEIDKIRAVNLKDFLKEGQSELNLDEVNTLSISKQRDYYRSYDEYLRDRRKILAASAKYWMTQHESGAAGARGKASSFIELLLDDGFKKLNERLETLEKTTDKALRDQINQSVGITDAFARIPILDDVAVAAIKKNLGSEEAANFFRHIQTGRRKSVPPFNYRTHYFPRLISPLRHIRNSKASEAEQKKTFIKKIQAALSEIEESLKSEPEDLEARLNIFKQVYRDYRLAIEEAFLLAYRDPRLEEIYKLFWIDEVIDADRSGALQAWKDHLKQRAEKYPDWDRQREILFNRGALRMENLEKLIHPGIAVFKRPVGDETGFVARDSDGNYHVGFAELNNGNAYFEFNTPDSWDSVYHQILQAFLDEAERYYAVEANRKNPLGFMENLNERILQAAPQKFPTTVKVESEFPDAFGKLKLDGKKIIERMAAYSLKGESSSSLLPGYAVSRTGDVYVRQPFGSKKRWIKTKTVTLDQLDRFESTLSASRVVYSILMNPEKDKILRIFNLLDDLVGYQKQVEALIQKVAISAELEKVKERFDAAGIEIPRHTGRIDRRTIPGLRGNAEESAEGTEGQSLGNENPNDKKKPRPVSINLRKRELSPDRLQLFTRDYRDLFRAVLGLFNHQKRAARKSKEGLWEGFFKIIEDGSTVDYAVYLPGQEKPFKYLGEIPRAVMTNAELILIQNSKRGTRPGVSTGKKARPSDDDPAVTKLRPDVARKMENQFRLEWKGIAENLWWLMFNPFSIWPQKVGKPLEDQPHHLTLSRADSLVSQKDMRRKENLLDAVKLFLDLNDAASIQDEEKFRLAVNGWYHSDAPDAVRAGASQSQAHAHLVRFSFPIERASLLPRLQIRNVDVSELSDGWGSGIALTSTRNHMVELVDLLSQTIALITSKGHSFNLITSLSGDGKSIRVFVAVRVKSGPEYFDSEWGFSEFSRVVIIDNPARFYRMSPELQEAYSKITDSTERIQWINENRLAGKLSDVNPNLRDDVIKSLNQITAPRDYLSQIFDGLKAANQDEVISEFTPQADSAEGQSLGEADVALGKKILKASKALLSKKISRSDVEQFSENKTKMDPSLAEAIEQILKENGLDDPGQVSYNLSHLIAFMRNKEKREANAPITKAEPVSTLEPEKKKIEPPQPVEPSQAPKLTDEIVGVDASARSEIETVEDEPKEKARMKLTQADTFLTLTESSDLSNDFKQSGIMDAFSVLGAAYLKSMEGHILDRKAIAEQVRNDRGLPVLLVEQDVFGRAVVKTNREFFDPTIGGIYIETYRKTLQFLIDKKPELMEFLLERRNQEMYLDYFALSDFQYYLTQQYDDFVVLYSEKNINEGMAFEGAKYIEEYIQAVHDFDSSELGTPKRYKAEEALFGGKKHFRYRKFSLKKSSHRKNYPRAVLLAEENPSTLSQVVSLKEARRNPKLWDDPAVMIVDDVAYQSEDWRDIPGKKGEKYPGEKVVLAAWQGKFFFLYTSRSHTVQGIKIHLWRSSDLFMMGRHFAKNPLSENMDDTKGRLSVLLDALIYDEDSIEMRPKEEFEDWAENNHGAVNSALMRGAADYSKFQRDESDDSKFRQIIQGLAFDAMRSLETSDADRDLLSHIKGYQSVLLAAVELERLTEDMSSIEASLSAKKRKPETRKFELALAIRKAKQEAGASSLGKKLNQVYAEIETADDIAAHISSKPFEKFVTELLGNVATALIPELQAAVAVPTVKLTVPAVQLSDDAKFLLANPKILADALKNKHGINLDAKSNYVIDASFLHQAGAEKFIQQLGASVAVTFASGTPDADLASKLRGTRRVGYGHNNILDQKKLRGMSNPILILPSGISFKFSEKSDWKKRGVEAEPALVNPYETSEFVRLVEIILQTRKLKDNGVSFPVIDQEMLNSVVTLLNNLAKEELTREAIGRAA